MSSAAVARRLPGAGDATTRTQRSATIAAFVSHGLLFASWTAHIPQVKDHIGLTDGTLGLALLGAPAGSVAAMLVVARILPAVGSKRMVQLSLLGYSLAGPLVGLADSLPELFATLFAWGVFQGTLDVSMNTQAVTVERAASRPLMSGFHACWSIGAFAGAGIGALGVAAGLSLTRQLLALAVPVLLVTGWLTTRMLPDPAGPVSSSRDGTAPGRTALRLSRPVLILGAIAFASMLCEGASADWASVYLRGSIHVGAAAAGLGYTGFALMMVIVRLSGNRLLSRFRRERLLPVLAAVATAGFTAALLAGRSVAVIAGFGCLGIGLALVVPTVNSAAGRLPGISPGTAIAMVSAWGWAGFVFGPPIIGQLASATSLSVALGLLPVLTACIVVVTARARALRGRLTGPGATASGHARERAPAPGGSPGPGRSAAG
ncbi:MAG TPA: MFS transporter [Streptosporangiaceae bacterium]|nr:MFS transporter [Streptosporangiaceae bacterium]